VTASWPIDFLQPLWLLLLLPALVLLRAWGSGAGRSFLVFPGMNILAALGQPPKDRMLQSMSLLPWVAAASLIIALARPVVTLPPGPDDSIEGLDMVIAFDVSFSMNITDLIENGRPQRRFEVARDAVEEFVALRPHDRIGLVAFAGRPVTVTPLTRDHNWLMRAINNLRLNDRDGRGTVIEPGTAIGSAIAASATRLMELDDNDAAKVIVLVTDGANNSGKISPLEAAEHAATLGIKIYTIAIGTEDGRLPGQDVNAPKQEFDLPTLRKISRLTGGTSYWAQSGEELEKALASIDDLETSPDERMEPRHRDAGAPLVFAGLLAICLLIATRMLNPPALRT